MEHSYCEHESRDEQEREEPFNIGVLLLDADEIDESLPGLHFGRGVGGEPTGEGEAVDIALLEYGLDVAAPVEGSPGVHAALPTMPHPSERDLEVQGVDETVVLHEGPRRGALS